MTLLAPRRWPTSPRLSSASWRRRKHNSPRSERKDDHEVEDFDDEHLDGLRNAAGHHPARLMQQFNPHNEFLYAKGGAEPEAKGLESDERVRVINAMQACQLIIVSK